jgi:hypothetical protein
MATRYSGQDIGIFTAGGIALVAAGTNFTFSMTNEKQDAGLIARLGKNSQGVKTNCKLSVDLASVVSGSQRVSHVNVTAFTIGGVSYLNVLKSFTLSGSFEHVMQAGVGEKYGKPQVTAKDYQISVDIDVESDDAKTLFDFLGGSDFSNNDQTVSITVNSVVLTFAMNLNEATLTGQRYALQQISMSFDGGDPGAGVYPAAPTGTSTILEKALNAPTTEVSFTFQNALASDTHGIKASGTAVFDSFSFKVVDGQLVEENYSFVTYSTVTLAASS